MRNPLHPFSAAVVAATLCVVPWATAQDAPTTRPTTRNATPVGPIDEQSVNDTDIGRRLIAGAKTLLADGKLAMPAMPAVGVRAKVTLQPATGAPLTPDAIYRDRADGVVVLASVVTKPDVRVGPASGIVVSTDGVIVTNYHVIAAKDGIAGFVAGTRDKRVLPVTKILAASEAFDVAVVQVDVGDRPLKPLPIAERAAVGADVFVISHPNRNYWFFSRGQVARYSVQFRKTEPVDTLQITADFARGSSGSPILNTAGEAVGMVCSTNSIYYSTTPLGDQKNLQMVVKSCVTSRQILELFER